MASKADAAAADGGPAPAPTGPAAANGSNHPMAEQLSARIAADGAERKAQAAAKVAARRVAASRGNPRLGSSVAGTTLVSLIPAAGGAITEREGNPSHGVEQLIKRAMIASAGGSLVVRYHTGRVVPRWFAEPSSYAADGAMKRYDDTDATNGEPAASGPPGRPSGRSPRGTMLAPAKRGTPRGSAPPTSSHLSIGWGQWGGGSGGRPASAR